MQWIILKLREIVIFCLIGKIGLVTWIYYNSAGITNEQYQYYKNQTIIKPNKKNIDFFQVLSWIRNQTNKQSIIIVWLLSLNSSEILLSAQRLAYVTDARIYAEGIPRYQIRLNQINQLYDESININHKLYRFDFYRVYFEYR